VGKGGIVKDEQKIRKVLNEIKDFGKSLGLAHKNEAEAPREKEKKNREYFVLWELRAAQNQ
jgi:23S rRNA (cytidine1920-2'-O)/16S rRNA (cytidine1409-2'-O)-methyltransferase